MTEGTQLVGFDPQTCAVACAPSAIPGLPPGNLATGLAFCESPRRLWVLTDVPSLMQLTVPIGGGCPTLASTCSLIGAIAGGRVTGGLAISESLKTVFYSASFFSGLPANLIYAAPLANPCTPACQLRYDCSTQPLGPLTGLAFDDCTRTIYETDGQQVVAGKFQPTNCTTVTGIQCCITPVPPRFAGLELEPSHPTSWGSPCTALPCQACPNVTLTTLGDPSIGNLLFRFQIANAPTNSNIGVVFFGSGACTAGTPFSCGLIYPSSNTVLCTNFVPTGTGACTGTATCPTPIPIIPGLCGMRLCVQALLYCAPGGYTLSNAINLMITDT